MKKPVRKKNLPPPSNADAPQMMNLALFIMLLAFFIVLNSLSSFDEELAKPVVESLGTTFSTELRLEETKTSLKDDPAQALHQGDTIERLDALFQAQISGYEATKSKSRGTMTVNVSLADFSKAVMSLNQEDLSVTRSAPKDAPFFLPTLVSILKSDEQGRTYRMDMVYHIKGNPPEVENENPKEIVSVMQRAGQLTRRLESAGMSQRLLSFSLEEGDPEQVSLVFSPHYPFDPSYGKEEEGGVE